MKHLTITLKELTCTDPQDPRRDELYFITATNGSSNTTTSIRKIMRGEKRSYDELNNEQRVLFDGNFDELSPIVITAMEQRAIQDNNAISEQLEIIAGMGVKIARRNIETKMIGAPELYKKITKLIMGNVINLFKQVFKDSALGHKVIPIPFSEDSEYPVQYVMSLTSDEAPTYDYKIVLEVTIS